MAIFRSLEGESLEDYSIRLAQRWRIGQKSLDNGVILLIFVNDRKMRLEVGYGLEPVIPDIVAGTLIRETLAPRFREQRYAAGIEAAVDAIYGRIAGEPGPKVPAASRGRPLPPSAVLLLLIIFGVLGVALLSAIRNSSRRAVTAGGRGWRSHPPIVYGGGRGWSGGGGGGGGFSGGGGGFGGGGASGSW